VDRPTLSDVIWSPERFFIFLFFGAWVAASLTQWILFPLWLIVGVPILALLQLITEGIESWYNWYKQETH